MKNINLRLLSAAVLTLALGLSVLAAPQPAMANDEDAEPMPGRTDGSDAAMTWAVHEPFQAFYESLEWHEASTENDIFFDPEQGEFVFDIPGGNWAVFGGAWGDRDNERLEVHLRGSWGFYGGNDPDSTEFTDRFSSASISIDGDHGELVADYRHQADGEDVEDLSSVVVAELDLSAVEWSSDDEHALVLENVPATVTDEVGALLPGADPGDQLAPFTIQVEDEVSHPEDGTVSWGIHEPLRDHFDNLDFSQTNVSAYAEYDSESEDFTLPLRAHYDEEAETLHAESDDDMHFYGWEGDDHPDEQGTMLARPHVHIEDGHGSLTVDHARHISEGMWEVDEDVHLADLDLSEMDWEPDENGELIVEDIPVIVTEEGAETVSDFWGVAVGDELDPLTLHITDGDDDDHNGSDVVDRFAGTGRIETAIAVAQGQYEDGAADTVVLARADEYADALSGTTVATAVDGPLLITSSDGLVDIVGDELSRLLGGEGQVLLLGGTDALDGQVEQAIGELGYAADRIAGPSRVETAIAIAEFLGNPEQTLVTTGYDYPDALTAGAAAASADGTVLLTQADEPHAEVDAYLEANPDAAPIAVGGPAARAYPEMDALVGETREETAIQVAEHYVDDPLHLGVARRDDFPDALSGGAYIGRLGGPLLLTYTDELPDNFVGYVDDRAEMLEGAAIFGGTDAISEDVEQQLDDLIGGGSDPVE